jgi:DHA2 family multidrug resistance protein-like MFS transporter
VGAAPPDAAGAASAISETGTELGGALGIAILGSVGAPVYRGDFGTQLHSAGALPQARETLAGAGAASSRLRGALGDQVLATAHTAFVHGFRVASLLAAGLAFLMAALGTVLRDAEPHQP